MDLIEEIHPIGMDEWSLLERRHLASYPDRNRTKESLRRKFQSLYLTKKRTGDPTCPPEVLQAKALQQAIREKAEVSSAGSDSFPEEEEEEEQEGDEVQAHDNQQERQTGGASATTEDGSSNVARSAPRQIFTVPVSRPRSRKKKRDDMDDDDELSMRDLMQYSMVQQQQSREERHEDRQLMMQMMTMMMMSVVRPNAADAQTVMNQMMGNLECAPRATNMQVRTSAVAPTTTRNECENNTNTNTSDK